MTALAWFSTLCTLISLVCCAVACVALRSMRAFASSRPQKRLSDLEVSQAELASSLESLTSALKRLSSKTLMREHREKQRGNTPPATKQEARERYLQGKTHAQIAMAALNGVNHEGD